MTETKSESELRQLNITELAESSREAWQNVKSRIPQDVLNEIGPNGGTFEKHMDVLTDPNYVQKFAGAGASRT